MPNILRVPLLGACLLAATACDNVGRAFDPNVGNPGPTPGTTTSRVQVVKAGGDARRGVPLVRATFPSGSGWQATVPIVVEFSESMHEDSILPTTRGGNDAKIVVRVKNQTQNLPVSYDFLASGRLLVIRPTSLTNQNNPTYQVLALPGPRDTDGIDLQVANTAGDVLAEFQVNQDESIKNGRILTTFPRHNQRDMIREAPYYVVFDRPCTLSSVTTANLRVRPQGGVGLPGTLEAALSAGSVDDPRILRFQPNSALAASTSYELVVDDTILFPNSGKLDFQRRTPFATFRTVGPAAPTAAVVVGNPTAGFPNKVNRGNFADLVLHVAVPADALAGDKVVARIYGGDRSTTATGDLAYFERSVLLASGGAQTATVSFAGALGTLLRPKLDEGNLSLAAQLQRGSEHSGYVLSGTSDQPLFDVTAPTVTKLGPPGPATGNDLYTDQESFVAYGKASEQLAAAELTDGIETAVELFASSSDGRFAMKPLSLGRLPAPRPYSLNLTDRAGNMLAGPVTGNIVQRGVVNGLFTDTLVVEAYDLATLAPIANASVLVDEDAVTVPATVQHLGTTDAQGRAVFASIGGTTRTVTIVRAGYHLVTLHGTAAARVCLPLRPQQNATATFEGTVTFQPGAGATALVGNNAYADPLVLAVQTTASAATTIPATAILPNRMQVITGFGGVFEPTSATGYTTQGFQMLGPTMAVPTPPGAPAAPGSTSTQSLVLINAPNTTTNVNGPAAKDFALATGLDTGSLVGGRPVVRMLASMTGFGGQALAGVGRAAAAGGAAYTVQATFGNPLVAGFAAYSPLLWLCTEAQDAAGRVSRHRALYLALFGIIDPTDPPGIPTITPPAGPFVGSPAVTFADVLDHDAGFTGASFHEITARDANGRLWFVLVPDTDDVGPPKTVQFPDLASHSVQGLQPGTWTVRVEDRRSYGTQANNYLLADRLRLEVHYARSASVPFTVN
jgi:hypothetical protein